MKKREVVKKAREFDYIINKGKRIKNDAFNVFITKTKSEIPLFGIAVSKKLGNAVERNKQKRQIRNIIDKNKKNFSNNNKYIIMIKKNGIEMTFEEKEKKLIKLITKENNEK
ncbi:MAG: ribonuclease P protein component [bacterium]